MARDGLSREAALARVRSQMPIEEKRAFPGVIAVDNTGAWENAEKQVRELWARWTA
jgi:dephospho-CoA kinase